MKGNSDMTTEALSTETTETTGKALLEHWSWAAEKGLMNKNTAGGLRAACGQVLSVLDDGEALDVRTLDIDDTLTRFVNLKKKDFKPAVLETYKRRFRQAVASYLAYLNDPGAWKPRTVERAGNGGDSDTDRAEPRPAKREPVTGGMVDYPFPVRDGQTARLVLPRDLRADEAKRLSAFMATLVVEEVAAS
jgi:hypothetical protein